MTGNPAETEKTTMSNTYAAEPPADHWADNPAHPVRNWKYEVENDDTRLGYLAWVKARAEETEDEVA